MSITGLDMGDSEPAEHFAPMSEKETKEVRRVFEMLCDYQAKSQIKKEINSLTEWIAANRNKAFAPGDNPIATSQARIDDLNRDLAKFEQIPYTDLKHRRISCADVAEVLAELGQKINRREIEEMLWEVDENLDGYLDWAEFRLMFNRNITDRTGLEPSRMFHLTQFLVYDVNNNRRVSRDETMHLLYARYERKMDDKLKQLFGEDMQEFGPGGGEISFSEYVAAMEKVQTDRFLHTNQGSKAKDLQKAVNESSKK